METILWHDYETFGATPSVDRPCQFAGIRTDLDLNVIGEPIQLYCKLADDYLPHPQACLITGITPQEANRDGLVEAEFISEINQEFSQPLTCVAGYNSIRFDDEVTRFTLFRNLLDPYAREWQNGNSRWDLIDVVRLVYAVRPEAIKWPYREDGAPSFRLEELTAINGISHDAAHDATSDVYATIALAKLIKENCPDLYELGFSMKDKRHVRSLLDTENKKPVFHVSGRISAEVGSCAVVVPLANHPVNNNSVIVYDLRYDPSEWINLSVDEIKARVFTSNEELASLGVSRIPLKGIHTNKCPVIAPMSITASIATEHLEKLSLNGDQLRMHLKTIRSIPDLEKKIAAVFDERDKDHAADNIDVDASLYSGGFIGQQDRKTLNEIIETDKQFLNEVTPVFQDSRFDELFFRYKARNYPEQLSEDEHERWESYRGQRIVQGGDRLLSLKDFIASLNTLSQNEGVTPRDLSILEDLKLYAESIVPYF